MKKLSAMIIAVFITGFSSIALSAADGSRYVYTVQSYKPYSYAFPHWGGMCTWRVDRYEADKIYDTWVETLGVSSAYSCSDYER